MKDKLCFVQFMHPGGEHRPGRDGFKGWNSGPHGRKFMLSKGRYKSDGKAHAGMLVFWGEWEPPSRLIFRFHDPKPSGPRFLFEPYFVSLPPDSGFQNTDPFVFGDRFLYTGCLQHTKRGYTQLRYLARGSVILFGSCVRSRFALDTVFVVEDHIDHSADDYRDHIRDRVPADYMPVTMEPWYASPKHQGQSHRLYFGATHRHPIEGMFSFVPCLPAAEAPQRFARPTIKLPGVVQPLLTQGKKLNPQPNLPEVRKLWDVVVDQVLAQDLSLGFRVELPKRLATHSKNR